MKKKKWFWYYYFILALPVFLYRIFIWEPQPYVEEYKDIFKNKESQLESFHDGEYSLYDIGERREIGTLRIEVNKKSEEIEVNGLGKTTSGNFGAAEWDYSFEEVEFDKIVFSPYEVGDYIIWASKGEDFGYILSLVKNEWFALEEYKNTNELIFVIEKVTSSALNRYIAGKGSVQINKIIYIQAYESIYSGFLINATNPLVQ